MASLKPGNRLEQQLRPKIDQSLELAAISPSTRVPVSASSSLDARRAVHREYPTVMVNLLRCPMHNRLFERPGWAAT
jgi:hypothetical protein